MHLAANLRRIMEERGLNQDALSHRSGVSQATISRILAGKHHTSASKVSKLACALGVTAADLLAPPPTDPLKRITPAGCMMLVGWLRNAARREPVVAKVLREFAANDFIRQCGAFD